MEMSKQKLFGLTVILLVSNFMHAMHRPAMAQEQKFTGSRGDIIGYLYTRINQIVAEEGGPSLQSRIEKYPVLFADFGSHCEFFLKNSRQDITQGSRLNERVYFKDVTRITAFRNVPVQSENYGLHVYVGDKRYQIKKWSGIATLADNVRGGDCSKIKDSDLTYRWPTFNFKVITGRNSVQWLEAGLTSIVEFRFSRAKGASLYDDILTKAKNKEAVVVDSKKSFEQLKEEARQKAEQSAEQRKEKRLQASSEQQLNERARQFRMNVAEGDESHCGLVIEVKDKVIKVQSTVGEYWLKRSQLYPAETKPCNFLNGVYQDP